MAVRGGYRWKPDAYRSTTSTTIQDFDPSANPPTGGVVMIAQAIAYDDAALKDVAYRAGVSDTEAAIVVLYEEPVVMDLTAFASMTGAEATAAWGTALTDFETRVAPAMPVLIRAIVPARQAAPKKAK